MANANTPKPEYYTTKKGEKAVRYVPPGGLVTMGARIVMVPGSGVTPAVAETVTGVLWTGYRNGYFTAIVSIAQKATP